MEWYKFRLTTWYRLTRGMTATQKGKFMDETVDALVDGQKGVNQLADAMLEEAAELSARQSERRRKKTNNGGSEEKTTVNHGEPRLTKVDHGEPRSTKKEEEKEKEEGSEEEKDREEDKKLAQYRAHARAREEVSPEQEAANLGYLQFAFAAAEIRKLLPPGVKVAAVYAAADAKGFTADELLAWANYHASNRWRTGSGTGTLIGPDNVAATIGRWASQRDNFRKNNGVTNDGTNNRTGTRRVGPLTQAQLLDGDPLD